MTSVQVSIGQMPVCAGQPDANVEQMRAWVAKAARAGSALVLFPELWHSGYDLAHAGLYAAPLNEGMFAQVRALAREHGIAIGGSLLEAHEGRFYNCFALYGSEGQLLAAYRKAHLFRLMEEDRWLAPGESAVCADTPWGKAGLAVCYDLRFPELFRRYAMGGAGLTLLPAEWPVRRIEHWRTLIRARAIENQMFLIAANCVGDSGKDQFGGHSAVIGPWGEVIVEAGFEPELLTCSVDLAAVAEARQRIPVLADRRPEVY